MSDNKLMELLSNEDFLRRILYLETKEEVKDAFLENGLEINNSDVEFLGLLLSSIINDKQLSEIELEQVCGGRINLNGYAKTLSTPFRMLSYGIAYGTGYVVKQTELLAIMVKNLIKGFWASWRA